MLKATLIVSQPGQPTQEVESGEREIPIGSALDNAVCLEPDAGVAHYHALIERRGDEFWLSDRGTRQGTTLNGEPVLVERKLEAGDTITLGGVCQVEFYTYDASARPADTADDASQTSYSSTSAASSQLGYAASSATGSAVYAASSSASSRGGHGAASHTFDEYDSHASPGAAADGGGGSSSSSKAIVAGVVGAVLVTGAVAAVWMFYPFGGCRPTARIMTPTSGTTLRSASAVRVEVGGERCISRVSYQLDGEEVAASDAEPYEATLDPQRLARFGAGNHVLTATIETTEGAEIRQPGEVYVALASAKDKQATAPTPAQPDTTPTAEQSTAGTSAPVAAADVQAMAERLASQISGKSGYVFEREMTSRIRARADEFANADAFARAAPHRQAVLKAFSDRGVRPLLGFVLAMSRSKFERAQDGIWRTPPAIARDYMTAGETPAADAAARREAEVAAFYLKDLLGVFESDNFDLAVACYGCTLAEADELRQRLSSVPASERRNFWRMRERGIVTEEQAERVVRFYAAGIVGENPRRFGASDDRTLSSLEY